MKYGDSRMAKSVETRKNERDNYIRGGGYTELYKARIRCMYVLKCYEPNFMLIAYLDTRGLIAISPFILPYL